MKMFGNLFFGFIIISILCCSSQDSDLDILRECTRVSDANILAEGEGCCAVFGAAVYRFQDELYTVQGFCSCDELLVSMTQNPVNCDGLKLCNEIEFEDIQNCITALEFYENATFLFSISWE